MEKPIGPLLDDLGIKADLHNGDLVCHAVVLAVVVSPSDEIPRLLISHDDSLSWITLSGVLNEALRIASQGDVYEDTVDDDD